VKRGARFTVFTVPDSAAQGDVCYVRQWGTERGLQRLRVGREAWGKVYCVYCA